MSSTTTKKVDTPRGIFAVVGKGPFIEKVREAQKKYSVNSNVFSADVDDYLDRWLEGLGFTLNNATVRNMRQDVGLFNPKTESNTRHKQRVPEKPVPGYKLKEYGVDLKTVKAFVLDFIADYVLDNNLKIWPVKISADMDQAIIDAIWYEYGFVLYFGSYRSWRNNTLEISGQSKEKGIALSKHVEKVKKQREAAAAATTGTNQKKVVEIPDTGHVLAKLEKEVIENAKKLGEGEWTSATHKATGMIGVRCSDGNGNDFLHVAVITHSIPINK